MDYTAMGFWAPTALTVLIALSGIFAWTHRQEFARQKELRDTERRLDGRIDGCEKEVAGLQSTVRGLPTHEDIQSLNKGVSELKVEVRSLPTHQDIRDLVEGVSGLKASAEHMSGNVDRMERLFLQKGFNAL